jgi:tRNA-dependent cyclodipeptide synthase
MSVSIAAETLDRPRLPIAADDASGRPYAHPYTDACAAIVDRAEHVVIGLSPFNGYFSAIAIQRMIAWGCRHFRKVDVLLPGYEAIYTLTAAGVAPIDATRKLRRELLRLRNTSLRSLQDHDVEQPQQRIRSWTRLLENRSYLALRQQVRRSYHEDFSVRQACRNAAINAVEGAMGRRPDERQLAQAVHYPLAELPFFVDSPAIYGVRSSVFAYPRPIALVRSLSIGSGAALARTDGQGFVSFE